MSRKKEPGLKNWEDVNNKLKKLSELEYQKQRLETDKNLKINAYEQAYNEEFEPIARQMDAITQEITEFVKNNRDEFKASKTKKLPNGSISCRVSTIVNIPDQNKTMQVLKKLKLEHCIKTSELLNKNILKTLSPDVLKKVNVSIISDENYTIKTNHAELVALYAAIK